MATLSTARTYTSGADLQNDCGALVKQLPDETVVVAGAGEKVLGVLKSVTLQVKGYDAAGNYSRDLTNEGCHVGVESCCDCIQMTTANLAIVPGDVLVADGTGTGVKVGASGEYPIGCAVSTSLDGCVNVNINISSVPLV